MTTQSTNLDSSNQSQLTIETQNEKIEKSNVDEEESSLISLYIPDRDETTNAACLPNAMEVKHNQQVNKSSEMNNYKVKDNLEMDTINCVNNAGRGNRPFPSNHRRISFTDNVINDHDSTINDDADDEIDVSDESDVVENDRLSYLSESEMKASVRSVTFDVDDDEEDFYAENMNYFDDIHGTEDFTFVRKMAENRSIFETNCFWNSRNVQTNQRYNETRHIVDSDESSTLCGSLTEKESRLIDMIEGMDWYIEDEFNNYLLDELAEPYRFFYDTGSDYTSEEDIKKAFDSFGLTIYGHDCTKIFDTFSVGQLEEVFEALDLNADGFIDVEDIIRELDLLGSYIQRTDRMRFRIYDERRMKQISFPQFINFCKAIDNMVYVKTE